MNEVSEKLFEYIDVLALKLGVASEYVFEMLVKQKVIEGYTYSFVISLASIIFWIATYKVAVYMTKNYDDLYEKDHEGMWIVVTVLLSVVSIIMILVCVVALPEYIMQIFNPEYYAIKELLEVFKK